MLKQRIITGIIIAPIALACVFLLPPFEFSLFIAAVLVVGAWEWANFAGLSQPLRYAYALITAVAIALVSFAPALPVLLVSLVWWAIALLFVVRYPDLARLWSHPAVVQVTGLVVLLPGWVALTQLKLLPDSSFMICLLFFLIWGADIGAYFTGRALGRHKLAQAVSPGKTWEGFFGGLTISIVIAALMSLYIGRPPLNTAEGAIFLLVCGLVAVVSVLGDLTISMYKRQRDIKDSSNLLPGHGGFLDRIDSLLSAGPLLTLYLLWAQWVTAAPVNL